MYKCPTAQVPVMRRIARKEKLTEKILAIFRSLETSTVEIFHREDAGDASPFIQCHKARKVAFY